MSKSLSQKQQKLQVVSCVLIFFFMMIGHELALEAVFSSFHNLDSLASTVTLFQFGFCFLFPLCISNEKVYETFPKSLDQALPYVRLSILVFGATGLATQSLKYVSYPTKVVFKSAKLIPTMMVSAIINPNNKKSKYGPMDYFAATLLCLGAAGYSYNSGGGSEEKSTLYGIILLTVSIVCDAIVPNLQQKLMSIPSSSYLSRKANKTHLIPIVISTKGDDSNDYDGNESSKNENIGLSAHAVMVNTNAAGFALLLLYMLLSGSLVDVISTAVVDPRLFLYLICIGLGLSTAVLAYTKLINASGSVVTVAVSTLRKCTTVLLSYLLFPKPLLQIHVFSGILVLIGVMVGTFCKHN